MSESSVRSGTPTVTVTMGAGIEPSTIGFGLDSVDNGGTIVGRLTGEEGITAVTVTFSKHFLSRPNAVIVTAAYIDLDTYGPYAVTGWDTSSFTITHKMTKSAAPTQVRPLYYYMVM